MYAVTRHATSRAGDPCPHDHVLLANVVEMLDETGGWKAPTTALWREHLHAATQLGRAAAARRALELGYGIAPDDGRSGRLRHWRIAGIPEVVMELHSKRAAEITAAVEEQGVDTYRARSVAARATRAVQRHVPEGELVARWRSELETVGWPAERLAKAVEAAAGSRIAGRPSRAGLHRALAVLSADDGPLARHKVFSRRHVLVELAPLLYGWEPRLIEAAAARLLADPDTIPLVGVAGAVEPVYALASVIAREQVIADRVAAGLARTDAPVATPEAVIAAVAATEEAIGALLAGEQRQAVEKICASGRGVELVVGVAGAGAGRTTMLAAVAAAFEASGCRVLGTATAGQAARTLGDGAKMSSSTLATLTGRLERGQLHLDDRSVVILDEAGMTDDIDLARLSTHAQLAGAKLIVVGDHRQLGAVGPGGGLAGLASRHPDAIHRLVDNRRQADRDERQALDQLRDGDIDQAVAWYAAHDRIRPVADREGALQAAVEAWAADTAAGAETGLLAWRRANVAELNSRARTWMAATGRLTGPELVVDGTAYRAGDHVITLTPDHPAGLVTSQRATISSVDTAARRVVLAADDGRAVTLGADQLGPERVAHGYATTVHRAQGATVERAHLFADGGGRELAYVAMSRARRSTSVNLVADGLDQAVEDLTRDGAIRRSPTWAIDTGQSDTDPTRSSARRPVTVAALGYAHTRLLTAATHPGAPPAAAAPLAEAQKTLAESCRRLEDLAACAGVYADGPIGQAARAARDATIRLGGLGHTARAGGWRERHQARRQLPAAAIAVEAAEQRLGQLATPEQSRLRQQVASLEVVVADAERALAAGRRRWQEAAQQHSAADQHRQRLNRPVTTVRRRLDQPRPPATQLRQRLTSPAPAIEPEPTVETPSI